MKILIWFIPLTLLLVACSGISQQTVGPTPTPIDEIQAVEKAKLLWQKAKDEKQDLSNGPCLSDEIIPDWVADIAHQPRIPADDLPENQCSSYREGRAHHFVELDEFGNFLRAY